MIDYDTGTWGISFIFKLQGSVFPKAICIALPNAIIAALLNIFWFGDEAGKGTAFTGIDEVWSGYTFVLGFLIVFRNNQAYSRFWEGVTLTNQLKGEWFNSISSLFAFCSVDEDKMEAVTHFQHRLVRLASMLHCTALQQICALDDDTLEVLNLDGFDEVHLESLKAAPDPCELVVNWLQRLIVEAHRARTIQIDAPILSRAFQELSRGAVNLSNVRKIRETPFPFPYAQMIVSMLLVHWIITPLLAAGQMVQWQWASVMCFLVTMSFWSLFYIALEIDQPFGEDANDLPVKGLQQSFNGKLLSLMSPVAKAVPTFILTEEAEGILPTGDDSDPGIPFKRAVSRYTSKLSESVGSFDRDSSGSEAPQSPGQGPESPLGRRMQRTVTLWDLPGAEVTPLRRKNSKDTPIEAEKSGLSNEDSTMPPENSSDAVAVAEEDDDSDDTKGVADRSVAHHDMHPSADFGIAHQHGNTSGDPVATAYTAVHISPRLQRNPAGTHPILSVGVPPDPEMPVMPLARKSAFPRCTDVKDCFGLDNEATVAQRI